MTEPQDTTPAEPVASFFVGVPDVRVDDLVGARGACEHVRKLAARLRDPARLAALGVSPPRGVLLAGPRGAGKASLAYALAAEAGQPIVHVKVSDLALLGHDAVEARVRAAFDEARAKAPAVVLLDDLDAWAKVADRARVPADRAKVALLVSLLDALARDGARVLVVGAVADLESVDDTLRLPGRLEDAIAVGLPDAEARKTFLARRLAQHPAIDAAALDLLARRTVRDTVTQLETMVRHAGYRAFDAGRDALVLEDLLGARRSLRCGAVADGMVMSAAARHVVAAHEAGHAIVQLFDGPRRGVEFVTIVPSTSGALGLHVAETIEVDDVRDTVEVRHRIAVMLGGREAERLLAGGPDGLATGAMSDLRRATMFASVAVTQQGLDAVFGPLAIDCIPRDGRAGLDALAVERTRAWVEAGEARARELLAQHRPAWEAVTAALLAEEELDGERVEQIVAGAQA